MAAGVEDAELVHSHTWYANLGGHLGEAAVRDPARRDQPQPRAAAPVEGRAARRWIRGFQLLRTDRARVGRCDHRGLRRHAARHHGGLPGDRSGAGPRRSQRHRPDGLRPRPRTDVLEKLRDRSRTAVRSSFRRADHPAEGHRTCSTRRPTSTRTRSSSCARARPTRRRSPPSSSGWWSELRTRRQGVLDRSRCSPAGGHPAAQPRHRVRLPFDLRAVRHRQPRGDGVRDRGRRDRDRRDREVVADGETGLLVPFEARTRRASRPTPTALSRGIAAPSTCWWATPTAGRAMGRAGRERVIERFAWPAIAEQTSALYRALAKPRNGGAG